jgi:hypothetical protein
MNNRMGLRGSQQLQGFSDGGRGALVRQTQGMGDLWSSITSALSSVVSGGGSIDWNPADSPLWSAEKGAVQSVTAPATAPTVQTPQAQAAAAAAAAAAASSKSSMMWILGGLALAGAGAYYISTKKKKD